MSEPKLILAIKDRAKVPPGGAYVYAQPESGQEFRHHALDVLYGMVKKHRRANNYPIGPEFRAEIDAAICQSLPEICMDKTPPEPLTPLVLLARFTKAMFGWLRDGLRVVPPHTFIARRETCLNCTHWAGDGAAFGLGRCGKCGCSGLKLHIANESCPLKKWGPS